MNRGFEVLKNAGKAAAELLFPSNIYCICCGNLINYTRPYSLCDDCLENIRWANGRVCEVCGKVMAEDNEEDICTDCQKNRHCFDKGYTCMVYGQMEKEMVHKYKFNGAVYMGEKLGQIMLDRILAEDLDIDCVTAVPMHPKKLKKRGYNQAELMAKTVAKGLGTDYNNQVLVRKSYKSPMNKLGAEQRHKNVSGAYALNKKVPDAGDLKGKRVLLIDDVYTTGSTVDECSRLLKEQGAEKVYVLTLAAGVGY